MFTLCIVGRAGCVFFIIADTFLVGTPALCTFGMATFGSLTVLRALFLLFFGIFVSHECSQARSMNIGSATCLVWVSTPASCTVSKGSISPLSGALHLLGTALLIFFGAFVSHVCNQTNSLNIGNITLVFSIATLVSCTIGGTR